MAIAVDKLPKRDTRLDGPECGKAREIGLASGQWYESPVPRATMKQLMKRRDGPAIRDTLIWFACLGGLGYLGWFTWGTWWAVPVFLAYGVFYASPGDSRWHECGHGTAFRTPWMNDVVYQIASFLVLRPATHWRWSHARHHTDTIIIGCDPEGSGSRPTPYRALVKEMFLLSSASTVFKRLWFHARGRQLPGEETYVPASELPKVYREARIYVAIIAATGAACIWTGSMLPAMFVFLPSFYGNWLVLLVGVCQHSGMHEDVLDHRLNSRTILVNPVIRFLYWNMNYHVEHHMFPMVPYHALPKLHEAMKDDCPAPVRGLRAGLREVIAALRQQHIDPAYSLTKPLPPTARPYRFGPKVEAGSGGGGLP